MVLNDLAPAFLAIELFTKKLPRIFKTTIIISDKWLSYNIPRKQLIHKERNKYRVGISLLITRSLPRIHRKKNVHKVVFKY